MTHLAEKGPLLAEIDHVNLVVSDLDPMTAFYTQVLGLTVTKRATIRGEWIGAVVGLADVVADVVYLDFPSGPRIELIHYVRPVGPVGAHAGVANVTGIRHLAFRVAEIDLAVAALKAAGVTLLSEVQTVPDAQVTYAGGLRKRLVYFHDPEGNLLELCEYRVRRDA